MDYEAGEYQKLVVRQYPPRALRETAEGRYWRQFKAPVVAQQVELVFYSKKTELLLFSAESSTGMQSRSSLCLTVPDPSNCSGQRAREHESRSCQDIRSVWCGLSLWFGRTVEATSLLSVQVGAVSHIDFSPVYPFHYAITSSTRVIIYDALTRQVRGWLSQQCIYKV